MTDEELDILTRTVIGEADDQGEPGQIAVVHVIRNRVQRPGWWGRGIIGVCQKPWQFSCWNANDPNRARILAIQPGEARYQAVRKLVQAAWAAADTTGGADHYFNPSLAKPAWAASLRPTAQIGDHDFYTSVPPPRPPMRPGQVLKTDTGKATLVQTLVGSAATLSPIVASVAGMDWKTAAALGAVALIGTGLALLAWRFSRG